MLDLISVNPVLQENPDIYIGASDRGMFDIPKRIAKETVELRCKIYDINKYKTISKLSIAESGQGARL